MHLSLYLNKPTLLLIHPKIICLHLFYYLGQITEDESIFYYPDGKTAANYSHPDFKPIFLSTIDWYNETYKQQVYSECKNVTECIYDYAVTGSKDFAVKGTLAVAEANEELETEIGM